MTVRRSPAPLPRSGNLVAALQSSRQALSAIQGQLDALLEALRDPAGVVDPEAADGLRDAAARASAAVARLAQTR